MNLEAVWSFYAGMLAQAVFLLVGKFERMVILKLLGCCAGLLLVKILGKEDGDLLLVAFIFPIIYIILFREKILQRINKEILTVWTMIGFYVALQTPFIADSPAAIIVLSIFSAIPVINAFAGFDKEFGWKVYFYMWFLVVLVFISASKFAYSTVADISGLHHTGAPVNSFTAFCVGMSFLYLAVNFWNVIRLCPLRQDQEDQVEDMQTLASEYDDGQVQWRKTALLLAVCGFLLAANYYRHFVSDEMLIPLLIVILPSMDRIKPSSKAALTTVANMDPPIKVDE